MSILERLRRDAGPIPPQCTPREREAIEAMEQLFQDAAAEIKRLKAELAEMRAALERLLPIADGSNPCVGASYELALELARQALTTDAGKAVADVLAAAVAWREAKIADMANQLHGNDLGPHHALEILSDAIAAYRRKEGRDDG